LRAAVQQRLAQTRRRALVWLLASAVAALGTDEAWPSARHHHVPTHLKHAQVHRSNAAEARHYKHGSKHSRRYARLRQSRHHVARAAIPSVSSPVERLAASLPPDLAAVKQALELVRQRRPSEATALARSISDPVAQKLVEWALLRLAESEARFERYATFIRASPDWPSIPMLRRRAEVRLWQEPHRAASVRRYLVGEPTSSEDRPGVKREIRAPQDRDERWRSVAGWHES
jgi:soluble lytic murein transglycosylase